jgi:WD40 repeat protein
MDEPDGETKEPGPYQGLDFYTEADARWFFGRDAERTRIIANLRTSRLTILYAESGVGKSSLLRAGVMARLHELASDSIKERGFARFVPVIFSEWQDEPVERLIGELQRQAEPFRVPVRAPALALHGSSLGDADDDLEVPFENGDSPHGDADNELVQAVREVARDTAATLVIILDQFEEHFRYRIKHGAPERLAEALAACVNTPGLPVHFMIAVREDAYGDLGGMFRGRIANVYKNYIHLEYLSRHAAGEAIERPLERYSEDHPGEPPMVPGPGLTEAVLKEVWRGNLALAPAPDQPGHSATTAAPSSDEIEAPFLQLVMQKLWEYERAQGSHVLRTETLEDTLGGAKRIVSEHLGDALKRLTGEEPSAVERMFGQLVTPSGAKVAHTTSDLAGLAECPEETVSAVLEKLDKERIVRAVDPAPGSSEGRYEIFHDKLAAAILEWLGQQKTQRKTEQLRLDKERAEEEKRQADEARKRADEEKRVQERLARRFRIATYCLIGLLGFVILLAAYSVVQTVNANDAKVKADRAKAAAVRAAGEAVRAAHQAAYFGLTSSGESQLASRPDLAILLFLAAYKESPQPLVERSLVATLHAVEMSGASGILHGHTDAVEAVAFNPRAPMLASASGDGTIRLWHVDGSSRYPIGRPLKAEGPVLSVAFSPDGRSLASGSFKKLVVWNVASGRQLSVEHPGGTVVSVAYSPNGEWLAAASLNGAVFVWNTHNSQTEVLRAPSMRAVRSIAFNRTSTLLAAGGPGGQLILWNVTTGQEIRPLLGRGNDVYALAFSPTADILAAAGAGNQIVEWDVDKGSQVQKTLAGQQPFIYGLAFNRSGNALAAGGDGQVELWNPLTSRQVATPLTGQHGAVYGVAFSADGRTLASGAADRTIRVWDYPPVRRYGVPLSPSHARAVLSVAVAPSGLIASGSSDGAIDVVGGSDRTPVKIAGPRGLHAVTFVEGGRVLASAGNDGAVRLWDPTTGRELGQLGRPQRHDQIFSLASDNRTTLVSGDANGDVRVWNVLSGNQVGPALTGDLSAVFAVAFNPHAREIAAAGNGRTILVWRASRSGWIPYRAIRLDDALFALAFSPNGSLLAAGGADGTIRVWSLAASPAAAPKELVAGAEFVRGLAFSPDGKTLASASSDHTVRLWDVGTDTQLGEPLTGDTNSVESVAFSPDGQFLVSGSDDRSVRLWPAPIPPSSFRVLSQEVCTFLGAGLNRAERSQYASHFQFPQTCPLVTPG